MADTQTQDQTNEANKHQPAGTNDTPSPLPGKGEAKADASGYRGNNPGTAGSGETHVQSSTPENAAGQLNPSAPGQTGTTPASTTD